MSAVSIKVDKVSKDFHLPHEKISTLKGAFTSLVRARHGKRSSYELQHALKDISFEIKEGEFFGIVGRNGSGKSTLLKILAGIYQPTKGHVSVTGRLVPFIELGVGFNPELTGRENVYLNGALLNFSETEVKAMYGEIVDFAELHDFMDQKLKNYSSGMQVRLAFSMAIRAKADILLVDEVLAVGDADFQRKCFEYFKTLKKNKKTVVFVSHDMAAIREFCDRALLIEENKISAVGRTEIIAGKYSKLFINDNITDEEDNHYIEESENRWGNGQVQIDKVLVVKNKDKNELDFSVIAQVNADVDSLIYGLHIVGQDGQELTAMNNRMLQQDDVKNLKSGQIINIQWNMLNVFNDGKYYVTITFVDEAGIAYDWYVNAAQFTVQRTTRSTTAILPPVKVKYRITTP